MKTCTTFRLFAAVVLLLPRGSSAFGQKQATTRAQFLNPHFRAKAVTKVHQTGPLQTANELGSLSKDVAKLKVTNVELKSEKSLQPNPAQETGGGSPAALLLSNSNTKYFLYHYNSGRLHNQIHSLWFAFEAR
jgi:hypothetical protein